MQVDELKILLALNGNQRLPHLEEEIFADKVATTVYLNELWLLPAPGVRWLEVNKYDLDTLVFYYARDVMRQRWPAAEHIIRSANKTIPAGFWWYDYCDTFHIAD